jgi:ech hydrogenase subunit F
MRGFPGLSQVIIRSLTGKPSTLMHPQRKRAYSTATRGRVENDIGRCIFCRLCAKNCPTKALAVSKENKEWQIDSLKCCTCRRCVEICPVKCLAMQNVYFPTVGSRGDGIYLTVLPPGERNKETEAPGKQDDS